MMILQFVMKKTQGPKNISYHQLKKKQVEIGTEKLKWIILEQQRYNQKFDSRIFISRFLGKSFSQSL